MTSDDPLRALAIGYAPTPARAALASLFALDDKLSGILQTTREPLVGQMRLTWWYEALARLDTATPPAEPVLRDLHATVLPAGVSGARLAGLTDGWDVLLEPSLDTAAIDRFAAQRGRQLFDMAGTVLTVADDRIGLAGEGWALADLSLRLSDPAERAVARSSAVARLDRALRGRWPRDARALGAMALSARFEMSAIVRPSASKRVGRLAWHRLTGY
ncbi:squalene/phytoene synthase family protein [Sphingomonas sp. OK281]|uniref:squalene/phytoene synthase family protein n=1 Tax=Sphingomonas sp. OK281 TaxID=1881067 RepID=UPI0008F207C8|nr:squalene/phytoene synthase family protein [Sphingomonas sp. OK281]SFN78491.1 phytoene synthase [Sphingomonas sp. OK281]